MPHDVLRRRSLFLVPLCLAGSATAFAEEGWRFHGRLRSAIGLVDTATESGMTFTSNDLYLTFARRAGHFAALAELEAFDHRIEGQTEEQLVRPRKAYIAYEPSHLKWFRANLGRQQLSGARALGSEMETRNADGRFGRIDGLKLDFAMLDGGLTLGVAGGNTFGTYGATTSDGEASMQVDPFSPGDGQSAKSGRALAAFLESTLGGADVRLWYGVEKNYFETTPTTTAAELATTGAGDGVVYDRLQKADASVGYSFGPVTVGVWQRKAWFKEPKRGVKADGGEIVKSADDKLRSRWQETTAGGVEYDSAERRPGEAATFVGLSVAQSRTSTDGLGKESTAAKLEDDKDLQQIGLSAGRREGAVIGSLNVAQNKTKGPVFLDKGDATKDKKKSRSLVYLALTFKM